MISSQPKQPGFTRFLPFFFFIIPVFLLSCFKTKQKHISPPGQVLTNVQYGTALTEANKQQALDLDIYMPAGSSAGKSYPLFVMIHGGGFKEGDKKEMESHCSLLAGAGYVGVSINYRLGWSGSDSKKCEGDTTAEYFALYRAVQDANAALRFLVLKAKEYHIDTSRIYIGGGSAGSTIAMYTHYLPAPEAAALMPNESRQLGKLNEGDNALRNTFAIKGILNLWGGIGDSAIISCANAVPMISFHGTADSISPYNIGREFSCAMYPVALGSACISRQLARYNVPYRLYLKTGAAHAPAAYHAPVTIPAAVDFFAGFGKDAEPKGKVIVE